MGCTIWKRGPIGPPASFLTVASGGENPVFHGFSPPLLYLPGIEFSQQNIYLLLFSVYGSFPLWFHVPGKLPGNNKPLNYYSWTIVPSVWQDNGTQDSRCLKPPCPSSLALWKRTPWKHTYSTWNIPYELLLFWTWDSGKRPGMDSDGCNYRQYTEAHMLYNMHLQQPCEITYGFWS